MSAAPVVPLAATALVTLRGFVSEKGLIAALLLVLAAMGFGAVLSDASLGHEGRLEADAGWAAAELLGWVLAVAYGAALAGRPGVLGSFALARPVSAALLLGGRFLGLAAGLFLYTAAVTMVLAAWLTAGQGAAPAAVAGMGWLLLLRLLVVLAAATFFAAVARPAVAVALAAAFCFAGWFAGNLAPGASPSGLRPLSGLAEFVLPNFPGLEAPLAGLPAVWAEVAVALSGPTLYAALYAGAMVLAALAAFPSRARRPLPAAS